MNRDRAEKEVFITKFILNAIAAGDCGVGGDSLSPPVVYECHEWIATDPNLNRPRERISIKFFIDSQGVRIVDPPYLISNHNSDKIISSIGDYFVGKVHDRIEGAL